MQAHRENGCACTFLETGGLKICENGCACTFLETGGFASLANKK